MKKSVKIYTAVHNTITILLFLLSFIMIKQNATPEILQDVILWSFITGLSLRMAFDLNTMNFYIGTMFTTASIFIFDWWYVPIITALSMIIYRFSCLMFGDDGKLKKRTFSREVFVVLNTSLCALLSAWVKCYFLSTYNLHLTEDIWAMIIVCVFESLIGLIFVHIDLKQSDIVSSVFKSIATHLKDTYLIYIVYFLMVINIVIMYQAHSYVGLIVASSYILALKTAFDKQEKVTQIESESYTDTLTGVKNKKFYIEAIPTEFSGSYAIFFIDFNGFKSINDKFGHDVGDEVIILGGNILTKAVREKDEVIRFGGDEFMLLISDADREVCKEVVSRIETICEENIYRKNDIEIKVSMSIGIAICPEESSLKEELSTIADEKMYLAKQEKSEKNIVYKI